MGAGRLPFRHLESFRADRERQMDVVTSPQPLDVRASLRPLWQRRWSIVAIVVLIAAGTYVYYRTQTPKYRTTTEIRIRTSEAEQALTGSSPSSPDDRTVADQARLVHTHAVAGQVARSVGWKSSLNKLLSKVTVSPQAGADFVLIQATDANPRRAATIANGFAR